MGSVSREVSQSRCAPKVPSESQKAHDALQSVMPATPVFDTAYACSHPVVDMPPVGDKAELDKSKARIDEKLSHLGKVMVEMQALGTDMEATKTEVAVLKRIHTFTRPLKDQEHFMQGRKESLGKQLKDLQDKFDGLEEQKQIKAIDFDQVTECLVQLNRFQFEQAVQVDKEDLVSSGGSSVGPPSSVDFGVL